GGVNHGEAVSIGMVLAAKLSSTLGMADMRDGERLRILLQRFDLPVALPAGLDPSALLAHMRLDKKAQGSGLRFILWDRAGAARIVAGVEEAAVLATLRS
ncbi:MAG: 3-dehydroquinate synthase, partial [Thermomonas sp.]